MLVKLGLLLGHRRAVVVLVDFFLTHFLFLPVQLVGCTPTSGLWGLWNNHFTVLFVTAGQQSCTYSAGSLQGHWGEHPLHAILTHWGCCWEPRIPLIIYYPRHDITLYVHQNSSLSWRQLSICAHFHLWVCLCVPYLCFHIVYLTSKLQPDWIGYIPLFLFHHFIPTLFLSLSLVSPVQWTKLSLEWLDITLLTLCPLPFLLSFWKVLGFKFSLFF